MYFISKKYDDQSLKKCLNTALVTLSKWFLQKYSRVLYYVYTQQRKTDSKLKASSSMLKARCLQAQDMLEKSTNNSCKLIHFLGG